MLAMLTGFRGLEHDAALEVFAALSSPTETYRQSPDRCELNKHAARGHTVLASAITHALDEESVIVIGTDAAGLAACPTRRL